MKILDPIAIKEIVEHGVDMPIKITNIKNPEKITTIERNLEEQKRSSDKNSYRKRKLCYI